MMIEQVVDSLFAKIADIIGSSGVGVFVAMDCENGGVLETFRTLKTSDLENRIIRLQNTMINLFMYL